MESWFHFFLILFLLYVQQWIESNQAPYDDLFFHDLIQEWKLSGSMFDFNDGIARMAFMYSAQVWTEVSALDSS